MRDLRLALGTWTAIVDTRDWRLGNQVRAIFLFGDGGVIVEPTVSQAAAFMEPIDIENGEYDAVFDDTGRQYEVKVVDGSTRLEPTDKVDLDRLMELIRNDPLVRSFVAADLEDPLRSTPTTYPVDRRAVREQDRSTLLVRAVLALAVSACSGQSTPTDAGHAVPVSEASATTSTYLATAEVEAVSTETEANVGTTAAESAQGAECPPIDTHVEILSVADAPVASQQRAAIQITLREGSDPCQARGHPGVTLIGGFDNLAEEQGCTIRWTSEEAELVTIDNDNPAHAIITFLDDPGSHPPSYVRVQLPGQWAKYHQWNLGTVLCQNAATHPGTYVSVIKPGPAPTG